MGWVGDLAAWALDGLAAAFQWVIALVAGMAQSVFAAAGGTIALVALLLWGLWMMGIFDDGGKGGKRWPAPATVCRPWGYLWCPWSTLPGPEPAPGGWTPPTRPPPARRSGGRSR